MADFIFKFDYADRKSSVKLAEDERNLIMTKLKPKNCESGKLY